MFVWPLWGAHRMLADAKSALLGELGLRFERAGAGLRRAVDDDDTARMAPLKDALLGLESSLRVVERASTWPWQPETPRLVVSAGRLRWSSPPCCYRSGPGCCSRCSTACCSDMG